MNNFQAKNSVTDELTTLMARVIELAKHESVTDRERGGIASEIKNALNIPGNIWLPEDWENYVPEWVSEDKQEEFMHEAWTEASQSSWDCTDSDWIRVEMYADTVAERWRTKDGHGALLSEDEFDERFTPVADDEGEMIRAKVPEGVERTSRRLWTVVDGDDGGLYITAGLHYVNRQGYVLTEEEWESEATTAPWGGSEE